MDMMAAAWKIDWHEMALQRLLASGAYGEVWIATLKDQYKVACKKMFHTNDILLDEDPEIEFLKRARHPRLVMFLGAGRMDGGNIFMVLEFCDQGDLTGFLYSTTNIPSWISRIDLLVDVAIGLTYLHLVHDSVHRDLKSQNVLLATEGKRIRAKIADFGTSKVLSRSTATVKLTREAAKSTEKGQAADKTHREASTSISTTLTTSTGTLLWMAPEVMSADTAFAVYGQPSDVYSFSMIMYEALIRGQPWSINNMKWANKIIDAVKAGQRPFISATDAEGAPDNFILLMNHCSSNRPEDRPVVRKIADTLQVISTTLARGEAIMQSSPVGQTSIKARLINKSDLEGAIAQKNPIPEIEMNQAIP